MMMINKKEKRYFTDREEWKHRKDKDIELKRV